MRRRRRCDRSWGKGWRWLGPALLAGLLAWSGCTVTKRNYKVLSFFFDGVPDPTLPPGAVARSASGEPVFVIVHRPYAEENCDACHRSKYRPSKEDSSVCLECHAGVRNAYPHMHGAIEASACLWCHSPHESAHPALLREVDRRLCTQCHSPSTLSTAKVPEHADAARSCLDCHSGHGGTSSFFLKTSPNPGGAGGAPTPTERK